MAASFHFGRSVKHSRIKIQLNSQTISNKYATEDNQRLKLVVY